MKDISNFNNTGDYLPIVNGAVIAELIVLFIVYYTPYFNSKYLMKWYETYRLSAVIADIFILIIGLVLARYVFNVFNLSWNLWKFLIIVLVIQIIHDVLFYILFTKIPTGTNKMLDLFKGYASEVGVGAILGDSFMIAIAVLLSSYFGHLTVNTNIIILIFSVYLLPYILYTK
jgi:uncharacterized protein YacL